MKALSLRICTPKQLLTHLKNYHWTKSTIIDGIVDFVDETEEQLKKSTYLEICKKHQQMIADFVYEEYASCQ